MVLYFSSGLSLFQFCSQFDFVGEEASADEAEAIEEVRSGAWGSGCYDHGADHN